MGLTPHCFLNMYYIHLFHVDGQSFLHGPAADQVAAIDLACILYRNYDFTKWSVAVSRNDGKRDPFDPIKFLWYRDTVEEY